MPNEQKTIEELLIELDAADTQLSNEASKAIRNLKRLLETVCTEIENLEDFLE